MNAETINADQPAKRQRSGGGRAFHSRVEPFVDFIREQRQRRKTWREIALSLSHEKGCAITAQGVHQFYRRYLRRQARPHWENAATASNAAGDSTSAETLPARKPLLAVTPPSRETRRPNPAELTLNDPTKI